MCVQTLAYALPLGTLTACFTVFFTILYFSMLSIVHTHVMVQTSIAFFLLLNSSETTFLCRLPSSSTCCLPHFPSKYPL
ncbi:Pentatricopeptide repeat-containing protein [Zea mays]|uniref:Pentatricopeptide repeat-containing protein n=1 Tax=Zea mays TaxID=4577 RepID=A0A1D6FPS4_MAIZE|nr:Pentatricopeptide repeat-containing protein [Zea mays]